jgi:hypothetical protein
MKEKMIFEKSLKFSKKYTMPDFVHVALHPFLQIQVKTSIGFLLFPFFFKEFGKVITHLPGHLQGPYFLCHGSGSFVLIYLLIYLDRVLLCNPGWPGTHHLPFYLLSAGITDVYHHACVGSGDLKDR